MLSLLPGNKAVLFHAVCQPRLGCRPAPKALFCCVLFKAYKTFLLSFKVHYQWWAQPFQAAQRHRKGQNHSILALLEVWKAETPFSRRELLKLGVVAHACNPNSWEAEVGGMQGGQPGSHARPCLRNSEHWRIRGEGSRRQRCGEQAQPLAID